MAVSYTHLRDRYQAPGINSEAPVVLDFQVEQPKNTAYSLKRSHLLRSTQYS